jgi:3-deoxy-D-manno-octulosonic-acid transferase
VHLLLYRLFIHLYQLAVTVISPFNAKARLWIQGRKNLLQRMQSAIEPSGKLIWMHCASLGEFEQGRPVLEQIKKNHPAYKILLTFFSPSGYEVRKDYTEADHIFYLPIDTKENAERFYDIVKPSLVMFIKYEYWFYYLYEAKKRKIPLILVSGIFREDQPFFKWYGKLHREMLQNFSWLLVQNGTSKDLLDTIGYNKNVVVSGDTRFDRVVEISESFVPIDLVERFCGNADVIVAGSTWTEDDKELAHYANTNRQIKFIIAPHNINDLRLNECKRYYHHSVKYSDVHNGLSMPGANVLIIDNVGMLSRLYKYATVCLVGGAFGGGGVHNVLEAAVYGKPVVYGPEYDEYAEAVELVEAGGAFSVETALELEQTFNLLMQKGSAYFSACEASYNYVQRKKGATGNVLELLYEKHLLTS